MTTLTHALKLTGAAVAGASVALVGAPVAGVTAQAHATDLPSIPSRPSTLTLPHLHGQLAHGHIIDTVLHDRTATLNTIDDATHKMVADLSLAVLPRAKKPSYQPVMTTTSARLIPDNIVTDLLNGAIANADTISANVGVISGLITEGAGVLTGALIGASAGAVFPLHLLTSLPGALIGSLATAVVVGGSSIPLGAIAGTLSTGALLGGLSFPLGALIGGVGGTLLGAVASSFIPAVIAGGIDLLLVGGATLAAGVGFGTVGALVGGALSLFTGPLMLITALPMAGLTALMFGISASLLTGFISGFSVIPVVIGGYMSGFVALPLWALIGMTLGALTGGIIQVLATSVLSAPLGLIPGAIMGALAGGLSGLVGGGVIGAVASILTSSLVLGTPAGAVIGAGLGATLSVIPALIVGAIMSRVKSFPAGRKTSGNDAIDRFVMAQSTARLIDLLESLKTGDVPTIQREWSYYLSHATRAKFGALAGALLFAIGGALTSFLPSALPGALIGGTGGVLVSALGYLAGNLLLVPVSFITRGIIAGLLGGGASLIGHGIIGALTGASSAHVLGLLGGGFLTLLPAGIFGTVTGLVTGGLPALIFLGGGALLALAILVAGSGIGALAGAIAGASIPFAIHSAGVITAIIGGALMVGIIGFIPGLILTLVGGALALIGGLITGVLGLVGGVLGFLGGALGKYIVAGFIGVGALVLGLVPPLLIGSGYGSLAGVISFIGGTVIGALILTLLAIIPLTLIGGALGGFTGVIMSPAWALLSGGSGALLGSISRFVHPLGVLALGAIMIMLAGGGALIGGGLTGVTGASVTALVSSIVGLFFGGLTGTIGDGVLSAGGITTIKDMGSRKPAKRSTPVKKIAPTSHPFFGTRYNHGVELSRAVTVHV